jgi:hypothetical protein
MKIGVEPTKARTNEDSANVSWSKDRRGSDPYGTQPQFPKKINSQYSD